MYAMVFVHRDHVRVVKVYENFDEAVAGAVRIVYGTFDPGNFEKILRKHHQAFYFDKFVQIVEVTT